MFSRTATLSAVALVILLSLETIDSASAAGVPISTRIENVARWTQGQILVAGQVTGYSHGTGEDPMEMRLFTKDNSVVAMAFLAYREATNSDEYNQELRNAVEFLLKAQTGRYDFYEYFDSSTKSWRNSGRFYTWSAHAIMALAFVSYYMARSFASERAYWLEVGRKAERTVNAWAITSLDASGAWVSYSQDGTRAYRVNDNGAILTGLSYMALLEAQFGSPSSAGRFTDYAQSVAGWLVSRQEANATSWGYGGIYTNTSQSEQDLAANCLALFGINNYYKVIDSLTQNPTPSANSMRSVMVQWMDAYLPSMVDSSWGPLLVRTQLGSTQYPKLAATAGWMMRVAADIWINIGTRHYQDITGRTYEWLTGMNELRLDLQSGFNRVGAPGGFIVGIRDGAASNTTDTWTSASAMFGMLHGRLISISELDGSAIGILSTIVVGSVVALFRRLKPKGRCA